MSEDPQRPFETPVQMQERARLLIAQALEATGQNATDLMHQAQELLKASIEATKRPK